MSTRTFAFVIKNGTVDVTSSYDISYDVTQTINPRRATKRSVAKEG